MWRAAPTIGLVRDCGGLAATAPEGRRPRPERPAAAPRTRDRGGSRGSTGTPVSWRTRPAMPRRTPAAPTARPRKASRAASDSTAPPARRRMSRGGPRDVGPGPRCICLDPRPNRRPPRSRWRSQEAPSDRTGRRAPGRVPPKNGPDHQRYAASGHDSWARALCQGQGEEDLERGLRKGAKRPNGTGENVVVLGSKATSRIVSHILSRSRRWYWNGPPASVCSLSTSIHLRPPFTFSFRLLRLRPPHVLPEINTAGLGSPCTPRPLLPGPADIAEHPAGILRRILERWPPPVKGGSRGVTDQRWRLCMTAAADVAR